MFDDDDNSPFLTIDETAEQICATQHVVSIK